MKCTFVSNQRRKNARNEWVEITARCRWDALTDGLCRYHHPNKKAACMIARREKLRAELARLDSILPPDAESKQNS